FGGAFGLSTSTEIGFNPYTDANGDKLMAKRTVDGRTNINANLWNVSGGGQVPSENVVSVKINSDWLSIEATQKELTLAMPDLNVGNICKVAGKARYFPDIILADTTFTDPNASDGSLIHTRTGTWTVGWLPVGKLQARRKYIQLPGAQARYFNVGQPRQPYGFNGYIGHVPFGNTTVTPYNNGLISAGIDFWSPADDFTLPANTGSVNKTYYINDDRAFVQFESTIVGFTENAVRNAEVFAGPFMEVKMASSDTKMVVGAACLEGQEDSEKVYMDNVSKVMAASDASIYIEGGFGKLTLQSSDYTGGVSTIAGAGDQADIDADGMVVVAEGYGLLGASPFLAMTLNKGDSLGDIEVITGGTFDLGGLSAAFDVALDNPSDVFGISAWDLGGSYAMGDLALGFATDSSSSWGLSAAMDIAGLGVSTTFGSSSPGDHKKTGITYSVGVTAALSGYNLAVGFDQDLQPTVGVDYDLGGLKLYGKYDAGYEEGSVGATLSF
ncbi:hypothetical protein N9O95_02925, partial [Alphaproteobacteria bacterium]|nr:hypothetical protein [Alphaproteobacteria bacterium]